MSWVQYWQAEDALGNLVSYNWNRKDQPRNLMAATGSNIYTGRKYERVRETVIAVSAVLVLLRNRISTDAVGVEITSLNKADNNKGAPSLNDIRRRPK